MIKLLLNKSCATGDNLSGSLKIFGCFAKKEPALMNRKPKTKTPLSRVCFKVMDGLLKRFNADAAVSFYQRLINNNASDMDKCVATLGAVGLLSLFVFNPFGGSGSSNNGRKTPKKTIKKRTIPKYEPIIKKELSDEEKVTEVKRKFNEEYKADAEKILEKFDKNNAQDVYKKSFLGEMLMKLLLELDSVDVSQMEDLEKKAKLKEGRKNTIHEIQGFLKEIDALKVD